MFNVIFRFVLFYYSCQQLLKVLRYCTSFILSWKSFSMYKVCGFGYFKMKNIIEIIVDDFRKGIIEIDSLQRCIKSAMIIYSCVVYEAKSFTVMIGGVGCYFQRRILKFQFLSFLYLVDYAHSRNFVKCTRTHVGSEGGNTKGNIKTVI